MSNGAWTNSSDAFDTDWLDPVSSNVVAYGNFVEMKCRAHAKGAYGVKLMLNGTETNWERITTTAIESGDADPRGMCRADLIVNFTSKESCNPASGGI